MAVTPALQIRDLRYSYRGAPVPALDGISLEVGAADQAAGEFVVILGASGAGKSTLCYTLNGLIPHFLRGEMTGEVRVFGRDTRDHSVSQLSEAAGLLFQEFESQLFCSNVELEVAFGPENLEVPPEEIRRRVTAALEAVGLSGLEQRDPVTLSGGQKQRLALAAVLALQPRLLVMDEPTTDLDPSTREALFQLTRRLCREQRMTAVMAEQETHAAALADRVVVLHQGQVVAEGSPGEILSRPEWLEELGVAPPPVPHLLSRLGEPPCLDPDTAADLLRDRGYEVNQRCAEELQAGDRSRAVAYGNPLFQVQELEHRFPNGTLALAGIDLSIREGEFVALVGPNGSGKTTLARHLNGLLRPTAGAVHVAGSPTLQLNVTAIGQTVGYVFQNPDHQLFAETVADEVSFGPRIRGLATDHIASRVEEALAAVGLSGREEEDPFSMTKGERQRVAVASVLATRPRALILDEPTTGLDYRERRSMMELVRRLNQSGHTILCITHHMEVVAEYAHRVVALRAGRLHLDGPTRDVLAREADLAEASIRPPDLARLGNRFGIPFLTLEEGIQVLKGARGSPLTAHGLDPERPEPCAMSGEPPSTPEHLNT